MRVSDNMCPHCPCLCTPSHHFCLAYTLESCLGLLCFLFLTGGDDGDETDEKTKLFDGSCGLGDKMGALGTGTDTMSQKAGDSSFCTLAAGRGVSRSSPLQGREGVEYKEYNQSTHFDCSQTNESVCRCVVMRFLRNILRCAA